jgi:hypothetical protein
MRIIKRGRRNIVIYPGSAPFGDRERKALDGQHEQATVRYDQLPDALRQVLTSPRDAAEAASKRG